MKALIVRRSETIREMPSGWLNKHTGRYYQTASAALRAVRRGDKSIAMLVPNVAVITTLIWEPTTKTGSAIVRAIS